MFNKSGIMEKLIPRDIGEPEDFEATFPSILKNSCSGSEITGDTAYKLSDTQAVNKVRDTSFKMICF